jgi:deoxyribodipyrimidine photo-lyase
VLLNRDLRVHDHPALARAVREAETVVPLFVLDDAILGGPFATPNRLAFLREALSDLDDALARRGGGLVVRQGDPVREALRVAHAAQARLILASADVSAYAGRRQSRLQRGCDDARVELELCPGVTVAPLDAVTTSSGTHFSVFSPYHRAWSSAPRRPVERAPRRLRLPPGVARSGSEHLANLVRPGASPGLPSGGEIEGRRRLTAWIRSGLPRYPELQDVPAADATSRLSPYLHFGCLSPLEVAERAAGRDGAGPFVRQLAWRDFFHQLLAGWPETAHDDLRGRGDRWRRDARGLESWKRGRTGYPLVDAAMRQLLEEGFVHNRARLVAGSFLAKHLYLDWRAGARHFFDWLVDGDVASNVGNWQWVAGTGADTRPNRMFNPTRQAERFDPDGAYVRRYVAELAGLPAREIHEPWKLGPRRLRALGYPAPLVDHGDAVERFRRARR